MSVNARIPKSLPVVRARGAASAPDIVIIIHVEPRRSSAPVYVCRSMRRPEHELISGTTLALFRS
jgi:hypothetical protein